MTTARAVTEALCLLTILFSLYSEYVKKEALEKFGDFKIRRQIRTVKHADELVLQAKKGTVQRGMTDRLTEIGICSAMEMNVEKTKVMRILRKRLHYYDGSESTAECGIFQLFG